MDLKIRIENSRGFPTELQRVRCENSDRRDDTTIGELHDIMRQTQPADAELFVRVQLKVKGGMLKEEKGPTGPKVKPTSDSVETGTLTASETGEEAKRTTNPKVKLRQVWTQPRNTPGIWITLKRGINQTRPNQASASLATLRNSRQ
jgi:hypothetical protein